MKRINILLSIVGLLLANNVYAFGKYKPFSATVEINNNTRYVLTKTYQHFYQMYPWEFPDIIQPNTVGKGNFEFI